MTGSVARVSVVIPVWDAYVGQGLVDAARSVREQEIPVELVIVDNASTVPLPPLQGAEVVRLEERVSRGAARNSGLERVRTPLVVFLDADDLIMRGALSTLVNGLESVPARSVRTVAILDGRTGTRHRTPRRLARTLARFRAPFAVANTIWSLLPTQGCTIMRVGDVRGCGGYGDSDYGEDWVLGASLAFRGRVSFDDSPGLIYRTREDSPGIASLSATVMLDNARRVRARIREDPAVPRWVRTALPVIAVAQWSAVRIAQPVYRSLRVRPASPGA